MDDAALLEALESGTLPKDALKHREHVRMAWLYLRRDGGEAGAGRIVGAIRRFAARHGVSGLYHETLTRVWIRLVADALARGPEGESFDGFLGAHPELADKDRPYAFYSRERLESQEAREGLIEPDRAPLP